MRTLKTLFALTILLLSGMFACKTDKNVVIINPGEITKTGQVDERFQSFNIEMAEIIGGNFWKPYDKMKADTAAKNSKQLDVGAAGSSLFQAMPPVDLYSSRLRILAKAIGPSYMRVSGTWANFTYFQDDDAPAAANPPKGFRGVLTRKEWKGVIDFSNSVDAKLITSFAVSEGVRDKDGVWTAVEAKKIAEFTKASGGNIVAAELFNEPNIPSAGAAPAGYNAQVFAKDIEAFRNFAKETLPGMLIAGPGSVGEGIKLLPEASMAMLSSNDLLSAEPKPQFDIFSYHFYGAVSQRCASMNKAFSTTPEEALTAGWLSKTDTVLEFNKQLRDKFVSGKPIWLTETADAACGGNPWAVTFLDCFRYIEQMGRLARGGVSVIFHNTLCASEYGLLDMETHLPRPHYWTAFLWAKLMGTDVYNAGTAIPGVDLFVHSLKGEAGGITLLVVNTNKEKVTLKIPAAGEQYTLTSSELQGKTVQLNGSELQLGSNDELPQVTGKPVKKGLLVLPPVSITFITFSKI
jgi:heparanase